jgi:hypothetical protein
MREPERGRAEGWKFALATKEGTARISRVERCPIWLHAAAAMGSSSGLTLSVYTSTSSQCFLSMSQDTSGLPAESSLL